MTSNIRYRVLPYKQGSKSAKALAEALGGKVLRLEGSTFKPRLTDRIVNWGRSDGLPSGFTGVMNTPTCTLFNDPSDVYGVTNKLRYFQEYGDSEYLPAFWTNEEDIPDEAFPVVCRTILSGHSGAGIVLADTRDDLVPAPLYVQYMKKKEEYRVHVGIKGNESVTISVQRKARRLSVNDEDVNWQVRNLAGGFVYTREGFTLPPACEQAAHLCLRASGLCFGAVDVIWNEKTEKAYVLEINTAPGLEGTTVTDYVNYFKS